MADLQIKVTTPADQTGLNQTAQNLTATQRHAAALTRQFEELQQSQKKVAAASSEMHEALQASARAANEEAKAADGKGVAIAAAATRMSAGAAGLAAAAAAMAVVAKRSTEEFAAYEERVVSLDAALARNGQLTGAYREELQQLAGNLETATNVADEQWLAVLTRLVQFGSRPETIGMDVEAVKNLAGIVGDVGTAAQVYTRALQGNFEMFGRYGIRVDEAATQTEKLAKLQEKLAQIGGGQLEARTNSLIGTYGKLKVQVDNTAQGIGTLIDRTLVLRSVLGMLTDAFDWWNDLLPDTVDKVSGLENAVGETAEAFNDLPDGNPFEKTKTGASEAKKEVDALIASMEAAHRRTLAEQDAQLKEELAGIDLQAATAEDTPENRLRFSTERRQAQLRAEVRRANRDFFAAGDAARTIESRLPGLTGEERARAEQELADQRSRQQVALAGVRTGNLGQLANLTNAQRALVPQSDPGAQKAFDDHTRLLQRMVSDAQQAADSASRAANKAATAERMAAWMDSVDARINAVIRQSSLNQQNIR